MHLLKAAIAFGLLAVAFAKPTKTSTLQVDPNIVDPDESAGDTKTAEFENGEGFVEGDMQTKTGNPDERNAVSDANKLWSNGVVPYVLDPGLSSTMRNLVQQAIADFQKHTCIKWVQRSNQPGYVDINSQRGGCFAYLGRSGGKQPLNLASGCGQKGIVIHEMLHTLGFAHEQARNDRDNYITVNWGNIKYGKASQFKKMGAGNENNQGFAYDYSSVMHYPDWGFSKNRKPVITTKDPSKQKLIGQRKGFSKVDIQEVNKLYKCNGKTGGGSTGGNTGVSTGGNTGGSTCRDKNVSFCFKIKTKHSYACSGSRNRAIQEYCPKSCGRC